MSCPLSPGEIRELIRKLQELEEWSSQEHQGTQAAASGKGYRRGDPKARASAAGPTVSCSAFPGIAPLASLWVLAEEAGPPFIGSQAVRVEEGPGPVPALVEDQAVFVCWNQKEALQRIHLAYVAGFWARVSLDTFTDQVCPFSSCESPEHTIVLRVCGLGGCVRFVNTLRSFEVRLLLVDFWLTAFRRKLSWKSSAKVLRLVCQRVSSHASQRKTQTCM